MARTTDTCLAPACASVAAIVAGDFQSAGKDFVLAIASQFSPAKIEQVWQTVQKAAGEYHTHGIMATRELQGRAVEVTSVTFARSDWNFLYICDDQWRITTASLLPTAQLDNEVAAEQRAAAAMVPIKAHVLADGTRVEPLFVPSRYGPLHGALTLPAGKGPFLVVVLVGGSGSNDLDEAIDGNKPFRDIVDGFAAAGIASLRYDKRQTDYPFKMAADVHLTVDEEETDDALTAVHLLAKQQHVDPRRVFVLGHSEGEVLAPRIGQRDPQLTRIIMMAAPVRRNRGG